MSFRAVPKTCEPFMRRLTFSFFLLPVCAATALAGPKVKEVDAAIDKGVAYLLSKQQPDGSWETEPRLSKPETTVDFVPSKYATYGGETAIATYALLSAGQTTKNEAVLKAVNWLERIDIHGTYAVGLRAQVWNMLSDQDKAAAFKFARDRDRDYVYYARMPKGSNAGFYTYLYGADLGGELKPGMPPLEKTGLPDKSQWDRSNSQFAVLGAWAVEQAGAELPAKYWEDEDQAWKTAQFADGSWTYNNVVNPNMVYETKPGGGVTVRAKNANDNILDSTPDMTCAGVATLYVTQDYMMRANARIFDACAGGISNVNIDRGLAWLDKHFDKLIKFKPGQVFHYGLFGVSRIGLASGRKYIGGVDWYDEGSQILVSSQNTDGNWNNTIHDTSFSILFLARGRAPVMMNKLIYANVPKKQVDPWDERPRDAANIARWMGKHSIEGLLNWQLVDLKYPVEEFHDAPILYISGSEAISLAPADVDKLRLFVQQGGMILGNADCGRKTFVTGFKALGSKLFPAYEFRPLPLNHPIFTEQYLASKWKTRPKLEGLSNGVRELMVLIGDVDPGRAWQTDSTKIREELFQLGGNIFLYATGKENLHYKGDGYLVTASADDGRPIQIARLMIGDNADPEPGGWRQLGAIMQNENKIHLDVIPVKPGTGELAKFKIAHLTGTAKLVLNDEKRKELKSFVDGGGTLIIDAAGGSSIFAESAEAELKEIFAPSAAQGLASPLPQTHALFSSPAKIDVRYRIYARQKMVGSQTEPRLRGIDVGGRTAIFYSREDLSAGLVGQPVDGVLGYEPRVAAELMRNMIMFAEKP